MPPRCLSTQDVSRTYRKAVRALSGLSSPSTWLLGLPGGLELTAPWLATRDLGRWLLGDTTDRARIWRILSFLCSTTYDRGFGLEGTSAGTPVSLWTEPDNAYFPTHLSNTNFQIKSDCRKCSHNTTVPSVLQQRDVEGSTRCRRWHRPTNSGQCKMFPGKARGSVLLPF